jgi:hypothetical protein
LPAEYGSASVIILATITSGTVTSTKEFTISITYADPNAPKTATITVLTVSDLFVGGNYQPALASGPVDVSAIFAGLPEGITVLGSKTNPSSGTNIRYDNTGNIRFYPTNTLTFTIAGGTILSITVTFTTPVGTTPADSIETKVGDGTAVVSTVVAGATTVAATGSSTTATVKNIATASNTTYISSIVIVYTLTPQEI